MDLGNGIAMFHNRLSIIDLSELGRQPMIDSLGNVLVFNGEIYNYKTLRSDLTALGHKFNSQTDSEVLLKCLEVWGIECLARIRGMFAFAYWDRRSQKLHLVRDPTGIKPLYWWRLPDGQGIVFASEIKAFRELPGFDARVNRKILRQFIEFGYGFDGSETIFEDVQKVMPGQRVTVSKGEIQGRVDYYQSFGASQIDAERPVTIDYLYQTFQDVVGEHLFADVPVGLLLSGGLDSGVICSIASRHTSVDTFTMGFSESVVDERPDARRVSRFIGSSHHEVMIEPRDILESIEEDSLWFDDLFADWGMISTRLLYRKCRELGLKVVVVGEGSDELFVGYDIFHEARRLPQYYPVLVRLFQLYRRYCGRRYGECFSEYYKVVREYLELSRGNLVEAVRLFESRNQLPNNYVMKVDKASMSVSVEARTPFLDSRIADLAYRIPTKRLVSDNDEKLILKSMAERYRLLPAETIQRKKFGAGIAGDWMDESKAFRSYAESVILAPNSWADELGVRDAMVQYFRNSRGGYRFPRAISIFRNLAWRLLVLNLWSRHYGVSN